MTRATPDATLFQTESPNRGSSGINPPHATLPPDRRLDIGAITDPDKVRAAVDWLRRGRGRGLSSEALLMAAVAGTAPADDALFGRTLPSCRFELYNCLRLTVDLPWTRRGLQPLGAAFREWQALAVAWDDLAATLADEIGPSWPDVDRGRTGFWPDTPKTDKRLRQALAHGGR